MTETAFAKQRFRPQPPKYGRKINSLQCIHFFTFHKPHFDWIVRKEIICVYSSGLQHRKQNNFPRLM